MVRPPPRSPRADTLLPYATRVRAAIAATKLRRAARLRPCKAVDAVGLTTLSQGRSRHPASTRAFGYIHLVHPFRIKARLPVRPADRRGGRFADGSQQYTNIVGMQDRKSVV